MVGRRRELWVTAAVSALCSFGALLCVGLGGDDGALLHIRLSLGGFLTVLVIVATSVGGYIQFALTADDDGTTPTQGDNNNDVAAATAGAAAVIDNSTVATTQTTPTTPTAPAPTAPTPTISKEDSGGAKKKGNGRSGNEAGVEHERKTLDSVAGDELTTNELDLCASMLETIAEAQLDDDMRDKVDRVKMLIASRGGRLNTPRLRPSVTFEEDEHHLEEYLGNFGLRRSSAVLPAFFPSLDDSGGGDDEYKSSDAGGDGDGDEDSVPAFMTPEAMLAGKKGHGNLMGKPVQLTDSYNTVDGAADLGPRSPVTPTPIMRRIPPLWQRHLDTVEIDSVKLASWDFCSFAALKVDPEDVKKGLNDNTSISGVPFAMRILSDQGLFQELDLDINAIKRYLRAVEGEYKFNPYHNRIHALDVMQSCHAVLMHSPQFLSRLTSIEKLALLLGAYVHDVGHPGVNNKLLEKLSNDPKNSIRPELADFAIMYNSKAILESFHISHAFHIAFSPNHPGGNPFATLTTDQFTKLRKLMIDLVLVTDMGQHFAFLAKIKSSIYKGGRPERLDLRDDESRLTLMKGVLHACDVSNPAKPKVTSLKWTSVVNQEFYEQGDLETVLYGQPQEALLIRRDLTTPEGKLEVAKGQAAFIKFIVAPLYDQLKTQLPFFMEVCDPCIQANTAHWTDVTKVQQELLAAAAAAAAKSSTAKGK